MTDAAVSTAAADVARELYERHAPHVYSLCLRRLGSREEAEDAAQTVFLNAFGALRRGSRPRFERAWLRRIAENVCHDRRARTPRTRDLDALEDVLASPEREPGALAGIERALAQLPDTQRKAIVLREWHGLSYREVGAELGLSEAAAEAVAFRARRALAERLRSRGNLSLVGWLKPAVGGSAAAAKVATVVGVAAVAAGSATAGYVGTRGKSSQAQPTRAGAVHTTVRPAAAPRARIASGTTRRSPRAARPEPRRGSKPPAETAAAAALPSQPSPPPARAEASGEPDTSVVPAATLPIEAAELPVEAPDLPVEVAVPDVPTVEGLPVPGADAPALPPLVPPAVPSVSVPPVPPVPPVAPPL